MTSRRERRQNHLDRRRAEQFTELIVTQKEDISDLKEKRPPETAITRVYNINEDGVGLTDDVTVSTISTPAAKYGDASRGYGAEYASKY